MAVSDATMRGLAIEILGVGSIVRTLDLGEEVGGVPAFDGSLEIPANGSLVFYEHGSWLTFTATGELHGSGSFPAAQVDWQFGSSTRDPLAVNLVQNESSVDLFVANGADVSGLTGDPGLLSQDGDIVPGSAAWNGHGQPQGSAAVVAATLLGSAAAVVDNTQFNGQIGDQAALLTALGISGPGLPPPITVEPPGTAGLVFARVFDGAADLVPADSNREDDWTTTREPTDAPPFLPGVTDNDNDATSINPQDDPADDMNPGQGTGAPRAADEGQTVLDLGLLDPAAVEAAEGTFHGGRGPDFLFGDETNNNLYGDAHNDLLFGGAGNDTLNGGSGADLLIDVDGEDGLQGGTGDDILITDDAILPGTIDIADNAGDTLDGGAGSDVLIGGAGADEIIGGTDDDWSHGGLGADTFVLAPGDGGPTIALADVISDFEDGVDLIGLGGGLGFADLTIDQGADVVGDATNDTVISITATSEVLATLNGIDSGTTINQDDFTVV
jgi:Ca2+-binding RTX toxin-like protein